MKLSITTRDAVEIYNSITEFFAKDVNMPRQFVWDLEDNYETLKTINDRFCKHRDKLMTPLVESGAVVSNGNGTVTVKKESKDEFLKVEKELNEYLDTTNDIEIKTASRDSVPETLSNKDWKAIKFMCS